jgi:protocatechuate 3,4-dioxygenase beta subunit
MSRRVSAWLVPAACGMALLAVVAAGCSSIGDAFGGGDSGSPATVTIKTTGRINDQGGTVRDEESRAGIIIPRGALNAPLTVQVGVTTSPGLPMDRAEKQIGATGYYFGPDGLIFNEPAIVELPFETFDIPSQSIQNALQVFCLHDGVWLRVCGHEIDADARVVRVRVDRLSTFIMATALQYSRIDWSAISGTVTDQDGNPLPGAIVEIDGASLYAVSDENGKYTIDTIGPGGYPVSARKPGYKLDDGRADVNLGETTTVNFQLTADAGQPGQMRVLVFSDDEGTKPVKNATVTLSDGPSQVPAAQTDGAGKVEFANLTAGEYSVKVAAQGLTDRTYGGIRVGAGQWTILGAPLTGTIPTEPGSLTGFVQDSEGTGIAGARVEIESGPQDVGRSTLTDANGVYTLDQLPEGTYSFAASADGYDTASTGPMQIDGGEATSYTFVLPPLGAGDLGAIEGQVLDEEGQPLAGVRVSMIQAPGQLLDATTAPDGTYQFAGLAPGTYSLRFSLPGYEPAMAENLIVSAGQTTTVNRRLFAAAG